MGKYLRKGKVSGEVVAVMEPPLGVRTRARTRTLALQKSSPPSSPDYLELRNRRLEKPAPKPASPKSVSPRKKKSEKREAEAEAEAEVSFIGENVLETDANNRSTRESTPCNLIRDSDSICCTPGSTTRPTNLTNSNRNRVSMNEFSNFAIPTAIEMEEFFSVAEHLQQRIFMEKYNFDPVNDCPLPGRYEWVKLDC